MLSPFGKICRKLRVDRGEFLKDMAKKLGVTPSYLSAVEIGKRNVPKEWLPIISKEYNLDAASYKELVKAWEISQSKVSLDLSGLETQDRETVFAFARKFNNLGEYDKQRIRELLKGGGE